MHDERGTAYAYPDEIDEWLENRRIVETSPKKTYGRPAFFIGAAASLVAVATTMVAADAAADKLNAIVAIETARSLSLSRLAHKDKIAYPDRGCESVRDLLTFNLFLQFTDGLVSYQAFALGAIEA